MHKTLENLKETLEDEIKKIVKKGDITPAELESVYKSIRTIDMIDNMGQGDSYGMSNGSYGYSRMRDSYGDFPDHAYGRSYDDSYGNRMYHDRGSYRNYHDDNSYRRGRSPVTGRYISRNAYDDGYSGHSIKDRMVARLESMYDEAKTDHEKQMVSDWIDRLSASN